MYVLYIFRDGTNRENLCRVGYRVSKLRSGPGPGRVYLIKPSIISALFKGIFRVVDNRLIIVYILYM